MISLLMVMVRNPLPSLFFTYSFLVQIIFILLRRLLLPQFPVYQSLRLQIQRAYLAAAVVNFPDIVHRLPVGTVAETRARRIDADLEAYLIPGWKDFSTFTKVSKEDKKCVVLYAHGGGYARGEAKMYMNYMERWVRVAAQAGIDLVFLSVEYPLTTKSAHPTQRDAFLDAYRHLLNRGVSSQNIVFMGDSAGGGLAVISGVHMLSLPLPQPAGTVLISPWMDMALSAYQGGNALVESDYFVPANDAVPTLVSMFIAGHPGTSTEINPLYRSSEELKSLNAQLILVGAAEFCLQDSKKWAETCRAANVRVEMVVEWGQMHIYAMGSKFIDPSVRTKTDAKIVDWIESCVH